MNLFKKLFGNGIDETQQQAIETALKKVVVPHAARSLADLDALQDARLKKGVLTLTLALPFPARSLWQQLTEQLEAALREAGFEQVKITWQTAVEIREVQAGVKPLEGVKNIIAVGSGKGGVGKSTTAVNLALALAQEGAQVGILDADIYGPSLPTMLGVHQRPQSEDGQHMQPIEVMGIKAMSIGFLIEEDTPMIWRGPLVTQTLVQLLNETRWGGLDYLVIDLPPGTGDVQLTLAQQIPVSGAIAVTTPQKVAVVDAKKAIAMFDKVKITTLGIIENMSTHICSCCGCEEAIFGESGGEVLAQENGVPLLGKLPLDKRICADMDAGKPTVVAEPDSPLARRYHEIAIKVGGRLAEKKKEYRQLFPEIVVK
ncbi:ATP-binding protein involved in chromosome partitioning [Sulfurivirga caldicuralii]|uniref:Iron-sulfur cluster carrier protein n=1 Tax=Sulfurivirga caldicuralii TaxID=364032 RepID=A0A1N6FJE9_9GAMM|nr:iron-sulfur cluster carrier protein ApbC [Sulfurivirga caldicuralii]SIN95356.1 ATP-binding protein involved in chromosome partitioning [Sulfurivirga caldicuralii]